MVQWNGKRRVKNAQGFRVAELRYVVRLSLDKVKFDTAGLRLTITYPAPEIEISHCYTAIIPGNHLRRKIASDFLKGLSGLVLRQLLFDSPANCPSPHWVVFGNNPRCPLSAHRLVSLLKDSFPLRAHFLRLKISPHPRFQISSWHLFTKSAG